jgi:Flp pilus assembly pilin Flp
MILRTHDHAARRPGVRALVTDRRGAIAVEYLMLIAFVGVTTAATLAGLLPRILQHYAQQRATLMQPYP